MIWQKETLVGSSRLHEAVWAQSFRLRCGMQMSDPSYSFARNYPYRSFKWASSWLCHFWDWIQYSADMIGSTKGTIQRFDTFTLQESKDWYEWGWVVQYQIVIWRLHSADCKHLQLRVSSEWGSLPRQGQAPCHSRVSISVPRGSSDHRGRWRSLQESCCNDITLHEICAEVHCQTRY